LSYTLRQRGGIETEVRRALDYYAVQAPEQVARFLAALDEATARILRDPLVSRKALGEGRRVKLVGFPYKLWFRVYEEHQIVFLVGLTHTRQDETELTPYL